MWQKVETELVASFAKLRYAEGLMGMTKTPNILVLFTDMQRADTIHALGDETI